MNSKKLRLFITFTYHINRVLNKLRVFIPEHILLVDTYTIYRLNLLSLNYFHNKIDQHVEIASLSMVDELTKCSGKRKDKFIERLNSGHICFVYKEKNSEVIMGYKWFKSTQKHFEEQYQHSIAMEKNSGWTYDAFVSPLFRQHGVWKSLSLYEIEYARTSGHNQIYCIVSSANMPSSRAHMSLGYMPVSCHLVIILFGHAFKYCIAQK